MFKINTLIQMNVRKLQLFCLGLPLLFPLVTGGSLPWPDFESGWLPIINGLEHVARLNIDHGLGEIPVLVDVSVKIKENIFPASGFRPDHPEERTGPVVYIYDDMYVNVSSSPVEDPLYRIFPRIPRQYEGSKMLLVGGAHVRVRAWKQTSLPADDFSQSGIMLKANTSKVSDSYSEVNHNLDEMPCLVVVRMKMHQGGGTIMADGVGSSMQVFAGMPDRSNAYLVYGYSNTTFRLWVDSSIYGAIFDGRKHTWFDMVISEGEAEIYAWKCSAITPQHNSRVVTKHTLDEVPEWWNIDVGYDLEPSLIRVSVLAEKPDGANMGFRFPGAMHLGYPAPSEVGNSVKHPAAGGLSYTYTTRYKFNFWQPKYFNNDSTIFIAESFGHGTNSEISQSESVYIVSWIYEENGGCPTPVIPNGFADTSVNGTSTGAHANASCNEGFMLKSKSKFYVYDYEVYRITCHKFGYWENVPSCLPKDKEVGAECNPAVDKCRDRHATCVIVPESNVYKCTCNDGYRHVNGHCKAQGKYLPKADYDSDWVWINRNKRWHLELEHGLDTAPMLVDVQVEVSGYVFHAIGFPPDARAYSSFASAVVYIYDNNFINVSVTPVPEGSYSETEMLVSQITRGWYGYQYNWGSYGRVRVRAWKATSLPSPDVFDDSAVLRANTSRASDSFYELKHDLGEYPGLVVVRAKMEHDGNEFYADGVGSALNVFNDEPGKTNAFLVYGFSDQGVRTWVDSSVKGAIFDGRERTNFDMVVSEATVEIYAWRVSTLTPFYTYKFSLDDDRFPNAAKIPTEYQLDDALNIAVAEVGDTASLNKGYRFPSSAYLADRYWYEGENRTYCIFGGFTYAYEHYFGYSKETNVLFYKPVNSRLRVPQYNTGAMMCIPESFGNGQYSEAAFDGVGIMYSWINADCGTPPEVENGYINTTINGTEVGAMAVLMCNDGYRLSYHHIPVCDPDLEWKVYTRCRPVECGEVEAPANGTMNVSGLTFGNNVTFQCDTGYQINGTEIVECLSTGNWSSNTPTCSLKIEEDDKKKTSGSMREEGSVVGILLAMYTLILVCIAI